MKFNIITPLARFENFEKLKNSLRKHNIVWHILVDQGTNHQIEEDEWINVYVCPNQGSDFWVRCNNAINWFVENFEPLENEYYGILNDDDNYEENFFEKIKNKFTENNNPELIIVSMLRGNKIPTDVVPIRRHPTTPLLADSRNMRVGGVGVEQFFIKGNLLKKHKIPLTAHGDGEFVVELVKNYKTTYLSDCFVLFNYFEPGRW